VPSTLVIDAPKNGNIGPIAIENVSMRLRTYSVATNMTSGPYGNLLLFISQQQTVAISNITFSKG
jgi:hypothetical protein